MAEKENKLKMQDGEWVVEKDMMNESILQATAATATLPLFIATRKGKLTDLKATCSVAAGSGESAVIAILKNGTTVMTTDVTLDATVSADDVVSGVINSALADVVVDDRIDIDITYTAGTATPLANIQITVGMEAKEVY